MANGSDKGLISAVPTINVGGQDKASLADNLLALLIVENTQGLYRCEARFTNYGSVNGKFDFLYFDRSTLDFGKRFKVKLGTDTIFDGKIMALEGQFPEGRSAELKILAEDRFQDLRMTRRTRTFADVKDSDVISQIAGEYGLSASVDIDGPQYKVLAQVNQSDLAFLRERARSVDAELWMDGNTLNAKSHASRNGGKVQMAYGSKLYEFAVLADLAGQRTSVAVNGWDVAGKSGLSHESTDSTISGELNGDSSGSSILSSALGQRKEAIAHTVPLTSSETQAIADAYFKMTARRFLVGHGVAETDSALRVGTYVDLQGLGPLFTGKYYLSEVRHRFDGAQGIRTEFTAERPGLGKG
jgi:phage protein D